jgi:hypothetical protein
VMAIIGGNWGGGGETMEVAVFRLLFEARVRATYQPGVAHDDSEQHKGYNCNRGDATLKHRR